MKVKLTTYPKKKTVIEKTKDKSISLLKKLDRINDQVFEFFETKEAKYLLFFVGLLLYLIARKIPLYYPVLEITGVISLLVLTLLGLCLKASSKWIKRA